MAMKALTLSMAGMAAFAATLDLGIGINMGNVLEAPIEGNWAPPAQEYYFDDYASVGFKTVRIPVRWNNHTMEIAPYTINATFMARVQEVVGWATSRGLNAIINLHHDTWLDDPANFDAMLPRFTAIWSQIATTFASAPPLLLFSCFNEPHLMTVAQLNTMWATFYATVRPSNPTRWIMFGGLQFDNPAWVLANPDALSIPHLGSDPAIALQIHDYTPFYFTSPPYSITDFTPTDAAFLSATMTNMSAWAGAHSNIPIFLGEWACSQNQPNATARMFYYNTMAAVLKAQGSAFAGFTTWDDNDLYIIYNRAARTWDTAVLKAIGL